MQFQYRHNIKYTWDSVIIVVWVSGIAQQ